MSTHVAKVEAMRFELKDIGQDRTDEVYMATLLGSLREEYDSVDEAWDNAHGDVRKISNLGCCEERVDGGASPFC